MDGSLQHMAETGMKFPDIRVVSEQAAAVYCTGQSTTVKSFPGLCVYEVSPGANTATAEAADAPCPSGCGTIAKTCPLRRLPGQPGAEVASKDAPY